MRRWYTIEEEEEDHDVRLGVLEPVPIGTPVTWCHRMVICAKKTGKLTRTVHFQPLNAHATRETHHAQSPFHQARSVPHGKRKSVFDAWNGYHSHYMQTTGITPPSSLHGAATGTALHRRATSHPETDIHDATTRSSPTSLGKPSVLTTPCYGLTPWRRVSSKPPTGSTSATGTA